MRAEAASDVSAHFREVAATWVDRYRHRPSFVERLAVLQSVLSASSAELASAAVLDVGGGPGLFSELVSRHGATAICLDPSEAMVRAGRSQGPLIAELLGPSDMKGTVLRVVGGIDAIGPPGIGRFDAILAIAVLEYVRDSAGFLDALARLLRPGGRLYVTLPEPASLIRRVEGPADGLAAAAGRMLHISRLRDREYSAVRPAAIEWRELLQHPPYREVAAHRLALGPHGPRRWLAPSVLVVAEKR